MASLLSNIFKGIYNLICGETKPSPEKPPQQQQQQNQWQQKPTQYKPHHQQYEQPQPHKPSHIQQQQQQQQQHGQGYPPVQSPRPHKQRVGLNQINQSDPHYTELRRRANEYGDKMASCFDRSQDAYRGGDRALAKELSNEGKRHKADMERLNKEASDWIFVRNNGDSQAGEIDLHGLYVKEAMSRTEEAISIARRSGAKEIRLIVGQGLHSTGGVAKIRPAIESLMQRERLTAELDPQNAGILVVRIDSSGRGMGADEIARRLQKDDERCIIM